MVVPHDPSSFLGLCKKALPASGIHRQCPLWMYPEPLLQTILILWTAADLLNYKTHLPLFSVDPTNFRE